jgi:MarR family transcriptional regulator, negative regulator of the multidrug operon emrRAB
MTNFASAEQRLVMTCRRYPDFPRRPVTLVRLVKHISKLVHDQSNIVLRPYGINHPEYNLMMMLYGTASGTMSPSELAEAAGEKSANITRLTNELSDKGLIARSASTDDRRKIELSLTAQGLALIDRLLPDICAVVIKQTRHLTVSEQAQFEKLLKKLLSGLAD